METTKQLTPNTIKRFWRNTAHRVQETNHWNNTESTTQAFTAKAAYNFIDKNGKNKTTGQCVDIHSKDSVLNLCCSERISNKLLWFKNKKYARLIEGINLFFMFISIFILYGYLDITFSYVIGSIWISHPIITLLISNRQIMTRIWLRSFLPWLQMYVCVSETIGFCDLCNWNRRICILGPPYLLSQFTIINSDATYLKREERWRITTQIITSILFKIFILCSIRLDYVNDIYPRDMIQLTITPKKFYLNNASLFMSKSISMIGLLFGQLIFRFKHKDKVYSLRTHYTLKPNKEWNKTNRNIRINKKSSLTIDVEHTTKVLKDRYDVSNNITV